MPSRYSSSSTTRNYGGSPAPLGVKVVSALLFVSGVLGALFALYGIGAAPLSGLLLLGLSVAEVYVAVGLWGFRERAYVWALGLELLAILGAVQQSNETGLVLSLVILLYLLAKWDADWR